MLQKKQQIAMVESETRAVKVRIDSRAEAQRITTNAEAKARAIIITAEAEKTATELKGKGEAEYARLLESTKLGKEMATMNIQKEAIQNVSQIAYVPHLPGVLNKKGIFMDSKMMMPMQKK